MGATKTTKCGRPYLKAGQNSENVNIRFVSEELSEIDEIMHEKEWSRSQTLRKLCLMGLDAYRQSRSAINAERLGARLARHNSAIKQVSQEMVETVEAAAGDYRDRIPKTTRYGYGIIVHDRGTCYDVNVDGKTVGEYGTFCSANEAAKARLAEKRNEQGDRLYEFSDTTQNKNAAL